MLRLLQLSPPKQSTARLQLRHTTARRAGRVLLLWHLTLRLWKPVQAGTPSLNFSLTMTRMLMTCPSEDVAGSK